MIFIKQKPQTFQYFMHTRSEIYNYGRLDGLQIHDIYSCPNFGISTKEELTRYFRLQKTKLFKLDLI